MAQQTKPRKFLYVWRDIVFSEQGPPDSVRRAVLFALSKHMNANTGGNAFASADTVSLSAGVSEKTAKKHLKIAAREGWVSRKHSGRTNHKGWRLYVYRALIPKHITNITPIERGEDITPPSVEGEEDSSSGGVNQGISW